jgi:G2/mitotic-specific cyclin-B, other
MTTVQTDINEKMRAILVDWLIEVHYKFKLLPETLFLTINLIDRYLERADVQRTRLQLVGVTAMLIACKFEEIYAPEVRDFVYITDKAYTREEILQMEYSMLSTLDFNITSASSLRFLERFAKISNASTQQFFMARYLIELPLIEYRMLKHNPSIQAASALYLAKKILPQYIPQQQA